MSQSRPGEQNGLWKGDKASYRAKHIWVQYNYGKATRCEADDTHDSSRYHWSNISGNYLRDISDWQQLCPKCHKAFDNGYSLDKGSCKNGHNVTSKDIYVRPNGNRECGLCKKQSQGIYRIKLKGQLA